MWESGRRIRGMGMNWVVGFEMTGKENLFIIMMNIKG